MRYSVGPNFNVPYCADFIVGSFFTAVGFAVERFNRLGKYCPIAFAAPLVTRFILTVAVSAAFTVVVQPRRPANAPASIRPLSILIPGFLHPRRLNLPD